MERNERVQGGVGVEGAQDFCGFVLKPKQYKAKSAGSSKTSLGPGTACWIQMSELAGLSPVTIHHFCSAQSEILQKVHGYAVLQSAGRTAQPDHRLGNPPSWSCTPTQKSRKAELRLHPPQEQLQAEDPGV